MYFDQSQSPSLFLQISYLYFISCLDQFWSYCNEFLAISSLSYTLNGNISLNNGLISKIQSLPESAEPLDPGGRGALPYIWSPWMLPLTGSVFWDFAPLRVGPERAFCIHKGRVFTNFAPLRVAVFRKIALEIDFLY